MNNLLYVLNDDGCPSAECLADIEKITFAEALSRPREILGTIRRVWSMSDWGWSVTEGKDILKRPAATYSISTGGWSGNEAVIGALRKTPLWDLYWEESRRGGHYKFEIPETVKESGVT